MNSVLRIIPWIAVVLLAILLLLSRYEPEKSGEILINRSAVLQEIEALGRVELVRYNFKEITELTEFSETYWNLFKLGPDQKIALISSGEEVGCIDLMKMQDDDIRIEGDTVYVKLPPPEICYYKLDMNKTRIYSLQTNPLKDETRFIQEAYRQAEDEIYQSAVNSGILLQTRRNAEVMLKPVFEKISGRTVIIQFSMNTRINGADQNR